jgi:hypothetical protein
MLHAKVRARDGKEDQTTASITLLDPATGAATGSGSYVPRTDNNESATTDLRASSGLVVKKGRNIRTRLSGSPCSAVLHADRQRAVGIIDGQFDSRRREPASG